MQSVGVGKGNWIQTLLDPQHPNVYIVTLPTLILFALGVRRGAAIYLFLSLGFVFLLR